jgi:ribosome-associated protein
MHEFSLGTHPWIELHNLLKVTGLCASGGEAKARIAAGEVRVDGAEELRKRCKILAGQVVEFAGQRLRVTS